MHKATGSPVLIGIYLSTNGTLAPLVSSLLPKQAKGWMAAIEQRLVQVGNGAVEAAA